MVHEDWLLQRKVECFGHGLVGAVGKLDDRLVAQCYLQKETQVQVQ